MERQDPVAIIATNDPPYNRMSLEFIDQLELLIGEIAGDDSIRAVVLTAEGLDNFSVGMNLKQLPGRFYRVQMPLGGKLLTYRKIRQLIVRPRFGVRF